MRPILLFLLLFTATTPKAQKVIYTIPADTVVLAYCDSTELIIENHTQNVPGFLFNTGNGRTIFKRGAQKLNDSLYLIGADTLNVPPPNTNFWSLTGNANTDTSVNYLGTNDYTPILFKIWGTEKMRLFADGNLGLGTRWTDNGYNLQVMASNGIYAPGSQHIIGNIGIASNTDVGYLDQKNGIRSDPGLGGTMIFEGNQQGWAYDMFSFTTDFNSPVKALWNQNSSIVKIGVGFTGPNVANLSGNVLLITPTYDVDTTGRTAWPATLRGIYYNPTLTNVAGSRHIAIETVTGDVVLGTTSGNTGIGTNSPTAQLHTTGSVRFAGLTNDNTQTNVLVSDAYGNLYYRSASSLAIDSPVRSSLAVNGFIRTKKLVLSPDDWADYVFDSTYRLPRLTEVESYIHREHRLPGIPSAAAVRKDSLDVGANQAALLKKIEELTLYAIDQNKKIDEQDRQLGALKKEVDELIASIGRKTQTTR